MVHIRKLRKSSTPAVGDIAFHDLPNESRIIRDAALTLTHDSSFFPFFFLLFQAVHVVVPPYFFICTTFLFLIFRVSLIEETGIFFFPEKFLRLRPE